MFSRRTKCCLAVVLSCLVGCGGPFNSGDRVLVDKFAYDAGVGMPHRFEVVVFKYPPRPVENGIPKNYIKRLLGLPGELLAIFFGQIFTYEPDADEAVLFEDKYERDIDGKLLEPLRDVDPSKLWQVRYMHIYGPSLPQVRDDPNSKRLFETPGKFRIVRKPPEVMLAMRRIVNDNDFQPSDFLTSFRVGDNPPRLISKRWVPRATSDWVPDDARGFIHQGSKKDDVDWLHYQHITRVPPGLNLDARAELITDFMDYNFPIVEGGERHPGENWVGDLMLECQLDVARPEGEFRMELSRGIFRYQARFDLATGKCNLFKILKDGKEEHLGSETVTRVKGPGQYSLRLANVDACLTLWVDEDLPFGREGVTYPPPEILAEGEKLDNAELAERRGPYKENDLKPASFGSRGADVKIHHLRVWRDTYYSLMPNYSDFGEAKVNDSFWRSPESWGPLHGLKPLVMYVQPGHYLCLGDNSPMSSDSRALDAEWGLVPQRLLLGRALMVYFPLNRAGPIR